MARSTEVNKYLSNEGRGSRRPRASWGCRGHPQAPRHPPLGLHSHSAVASAGEHLCRRGPSPLFWTGPWAEGGQEQQTVLSDPHPVTSGVRQGWGVLGDYVNLQQVHGDPLQGLWAPILASDLGVREP